jgi:hypothetical protein
MAASEGLRESKPAFSQNLPKISRSQSPISHHVSLPVKSMATDPYINCTGFQEQGCQGNIHTLHTDRVGPARIFWLPVVRKCSEIQTSRLSDRLEGATGTKWTQAAHASDHTVH